MTSLTDIRMALAAKLEEISGWQVSAWALSAPTPPGMHIFPAEITYDQAMGRGHDTVNLTVQAFVGYSTDIGAQMRLDELLAPAGPRSVKEALEVDPTLGNIVDNLRVTEATGYRLADRAGSPLITVGWTVEVAAPGGS